MFVVDTLIGNFDRHNGNWGILVDRKTNESIIAPIFDCGSTLFPRITEANINLALTNEEEMNKRIFVFPVSAIKQNSVKINPYDFLMQTNNNDCINALKDINMQINTTNIDNIIQQTPILSDNHKAFLQKNIQCRKTLILEAAELKHKRIYAIQHKKKSRKR